MRNLLLAAGLVGALEQADAPCIFSAGTRNPTPPPPTPPAPMASCARATITRETVTAYPMLPDILEELKMVLLDDRRWRSGEGSMRGDYRRQMAQILDDPRLTFEYSGPMPGYSHLAGKPAIAAQTIDGNHIRLSAFAGRDARSLARTVLHELVHVHQIRFLGKPINSSVQIAWEIPAYAMEEQMPPDAFVYRPPIACGPAPGAIPGPVAPMPPPPPNTGPCRNRRTPSSRGTGQYVAWSTPAGWLRVGPRYQFDKPQKVSEDIWGGRGDAPLVKTLLPLGPWATRDEASEEIVSRVTHARISYNALATPNNFVDANIGSSSYHLRISPSNSPDTTLDTGSAYEVHEEMKVLLSFGVTPRMVFNAPQTLVHATGRGTYYGPEKLNQWMLITAPVKNNSFTVSDGTGGTQGYQCDVAVGPHSDSFGLLPAMRQHMVRDVKVWAEARNVELDFSVEPYVDHGAPLCN